MPRPARQTAEPTSSCRKFGNDRRSDSVMQIGPGDQTQIRPSVAPNDGSSAMGFGRLPEIESAPLTPHEENMGRLNPRIQFDVILASAPGILRIAQQIAHLVRVAFHLAEFLNGHIHKRMLFAKWI